MVNGPEGDVLDWDAVRLAAGRGRRTAAAAADLHGEQGRGPEEGPQSAETDAPFPGERAVERAAGDGGQCWPQDGRGRRAGSCSTGWEKAEMASWLQHGAAAWRPRPVKRVFIPKAGRETARARDSRDRRQGAAGPDGGRAGARVGGPVRVPVVWVPAGPLLPGRDAGRLRDRTREDLQARVGAGRRPGRRVRPHRSFHASSASSAPSPPGDWIAAVAESGGDRPRPVRPDRAGQPARRGDQPRA